MDEKVRQELLQTLEAKMKEHEDRITNASADYFAGRVDGLNDAYRLLSTGEIET